MRNFQLCFVNILKLLLVAAICILCLNSVEGLQTTPYGEAGVAELPGKLKFVHVLFRHGDRMPLDPCPTDPWRDPKFWPTGWGQLTNIGKQQQYELGKWLRKRYNSLLDSRYNNEEILVRSTDVDRTLMSAESNLAGLYEPVGDDIWNTKIDWQPIPVHTVPEKYDPLAAKVSCPAFDYAMAKLDSSEEFQQLYARYGKLFDYLSQMCGSNIDSFLKVQYLNNTLFIESLYNKALPEWANTVYGSADMTFASNFAFAISTYNRQMARLKIGPLIKEMFNRFEEKAKGKLTPDRSVWIYSAHDTTVANVLNALKLFELHSPPYTACIMLEMRIDDNNTPFVSIFYKNTTAEPLLMHIPSCGVACPLDRLFELYADVLPVNWDHECKVSTMMLTYEEANVGAAAGILIFIIVTLLCISYGLMIYYRRRNYTLYTSYAQMA